MSPRFDERDEVSTTAFVWWLPWAAAAFASELAQTPLLLYSVTGRLSGGRRKEGRRRRPKPTTTD